MNDSGFFIGYIKITAGTGDGRYKSVEQETANVVWTALA